MYGFGRLFLSDEQQYNEQHQRNEQFQHQSWLQREMVKLLKHQVDCFTLLFSWCPLGKGFKTVGKFCTGV